MNPQLPKWFVYGLGGLLIVFVALLVLDKAYALNQIIRRENPQKTLSASGTGKVAAVPDLATITIGVVAQGATPQIVQEESNKKINRIIEGVKKEGVPKEDIVTSQFNIFPQHDYRDGKDTITGYQANQTITVKVKGIDKSQERLSRVMLSATDNGGNQVYGVSMGFDDPDNLRQQARKMAIEKAKEKAKELAEISGIKLGKVVTVSESGAPGYPMPMYDKGVSMGSAPAAERSAIAPTIEPGSQDITVEMTVVYEIR